MLVEITITTSYLITDVEDDINEIINRYNSDSSLCVTISLHRENQIIRLKLNELNYSNVKYGDMIVMRSYVYL